MNYDWEIKAIDETAMTMMVEYRETALPDVIATVACPYTPENILATVQEYAPNE